MASTTDDSPNNCALCGDQVAELTEEHVLPRWLLHDLAPGGPFTLEHNGHPMENRDGEVRHHPTAE